MVNLKTVQDLDIASQRLLMRVDLNVPLDDNGQITSDRRIQAALPTIRYCLENGASLVLMAHLGRPKGEHDPNFSLKPVAERLEQLLGDTRVILVHDPWQTSPTDQQRGEVRLLENLRFHPGEKQNDTEFARRLAEFGDVYVNDAFATCHRQHASMHAVPELFKEGRRVIGLLVEKELAALKDLLHEPEPLVVAILGGAKVKDKLGVLKSLRDKADIVLVGGAMAYTFLKADGQNVGDSKVEEDQLDTACELLASYGDRLVLPTDHVIADAPHGDARVEMAAGGIPEGWHGMDIGSRSIGRFLDEIQHAGTIIWNGPLGKFEDEPFQSGTREVAMAIAASHAKSVVGGGETGLAVEQFEVLEGMTHVSTGGGAFLNYLEDPNLPALSQIDRKQAASVLR